MTTNSIKLLALIATCTLAGAACNPSPQPHITTTNAQQHEEQVKEQLVQANKQRIRVENEMIDAYIARHQWQMTTTNSGLRYRILHSTAGDSIHINNTVQAAYSVYLLSGQFCYSSDSSGLLTFTVGNFDIPNGFHEMATLMRVGEKAQLIIPSHLAYGITGDNNKIPFSSPIVTTLEITKKIK